MEKHKLLIIMPFLRRTNIGLLAYIKNKWLRVLVVLVVGALFTLYSAVADLCTFIVKVVLRLPARIIWKIYDYFETLYILLQVAYYLDDDNNA